MNYRHIYHAGNPCDIVKHATLSQLVRRLLVKETPLTFLDTHAGIGLYDLHDERAQKTLEAESGFLQLMRADPAETPTLTPFRDLLKSFNQDAPDSPTIYPGSPSIFRALMRPQDRLFLCEKHPEDAATLKYRFHNDPQVIVHERNGYEAATALLPPKTPRGLMLIDPPFEETDEFDQLTEALITTHKRWSQGVIVFWYPLKDRMRLWRWHDALAATGIPKITCAEFIYEDETRADRLNGSGLILVNAPWHFDEEIKSLYNDLHKALQTKRQGISVKNLTPA